MFRDRPFCHLTDGLSAAGWSTNARPVEQADCPRGYPERRRDAEAGQLQRLVRPPPRPTRKAQMRSHSRCCEPSEEHPSAAANPALGIGRVEIGSQQLIVDRLDHEEREGDDEAEKRCSEKPGPTRVSKPRKQTCSRADYREAGLHTRRASIHRRKETGGHGIASLTGRRVLDEREIYTAAPAKTPEQIVARNSTIEYLTRGGLTDRRSAASLSPILRPIQGRGADNCSGEPAHQPRTQRSHHPRRSILLGNRVWRFKPQNSCRLKPEPWVVARMAKNEDQVDSPIFQERQARIDQAAADSLSLKFPNDPKRRQ